MASAHVGYKIAEGRAALRTDRIPYGLHDAVTILWIRQNAGGSSRGVCGRQALSWWPYLTKVYYTTMLRQSNCGRYGQPCRLLTEEESASLHTFYVLTL